MKVLYLFIVFTFIFQLEISSQDNPNQEMRAAWVATVANLDWPNSSDKGNVEAQKATFINLIKSLQEVNINAIFFQVRTECDALYQSEYEPWSRYLTGTQGKYPGFDPLKFAIEVCHDRGVEVHAWLNPYRVNTSKNDGGNYYSSKHVYRKHPEWILEYSDGKKILNPGLPAVQEYIKLIAGDIINKYDIDGLHFDDYFYAYGGTPTSLDLAAYQTYGSEYANIGDFRRGSINKMIKNVMDTVLTTKPFIRFGVSPFGIYGNNMNPPGISGLNAYGVIYCDPLAWLKEKSVDYINPQLYWPTGGFQDFGKLLPWWANWAKKYNRDVYAGQAIYRLEDNPALSFLDFGKVIHEYKEYFNLSKNEMLRFGGWSLEEIGRQVEIIRENRDNNAMGSVYFRAKDFDRVSGLKNFLYNGVYKYKSLLPEQYWKNSVKPGIVTNVRFENIPGESVSRIIWDNGDTLSRYAVYNTTNVDYPSSKNLLDITFNNFYIPSEDIVIENASIKIVKINRHWRRGDPSASFTLYKPIKPILKSPKDNYDSFSRVDTLSWFKSNNANLYEIQFSDNDQFDNLLGVFKTKDTILSAQYLEINGEKNYYWRVRASNIAGQSEFSEVRKLTTGFPKTPEFEYPLQDDKNVPLDLDFKYRISSKTDSLYMQVSRGGTEFKESKLIIDTIIKASNIFKHNKELYKYTIHYARLKAKNNLGGSNWTEITKFKTLMPVPDKTKITFPKNNTGLDESINKIEFTWESAKNASYYIFQISENDDFSNMEINKKVYTGLKFIHNNPPKKKWMYARVAGKNIGGDAVWSDLIHFILDNSVDVVDIKNKEDIFIFPNPSEDSFYLSTSGLKNKAELNVDIFNSNGIKLKSKSVVNVQENEIIPFEIKQFICQPCFIRVTSNDFTKTIKLFNK